MSNHYYCPDCGAIFWKGDEGGFIECGRVYRCCPECGGTDYEEAGECERCGSPCDPERHLCDVCEDDLETIVRSAVKEVVDSYNWLTEETAAEILFDYCEDKGFSRMFREGEK